MNGILSEARRIVAIGVTARDREDALAKQLDDLVANLAGLPLVPQAGREGSGETKPVVGSLQENRAPVGAAVRLVKPGDKQLGEEIREKNTPVSW